MARVEEVRARRPATVWRGENPVVEGGKAYIPENTDRAQRIVQHMIEACGIGFEAQTELYLFAVKQLDFATRDCGHDACKHVWSTAVLDTGFVACIRCGIAYEARSLTSQGESE